MMLSSDIAFSSMGSRSGLASLGPSFNEAGLFVDTRPDVSICEASERPVCEAS